MTNIHGSVYILLGIAVSAISYFVEYQKLVAFFWVGVIFMAVGLIKLSFKWILGSKLKSKKSQSNQASQDINKHFNPQQNVNQNKTNHMQKNPNVRPQHPPQNTQQYHNQHNSNANVQYQNHHLKNQPINSRVSFCSGCGNRLPAGGNFCSFCGKSLR